LNLYNTVWYDKVTEKPSIVNLDRNIEVVKKRVCRKRNCRKSCKSLV